MFRSLRRLINRQKSELMNKLGFRLFVYSDYQNQHYTMYRYRPEKPPGIYDAHTGIPLEATASAGSDNTGKTQD